MNTIEKYETIRGCLCFVIVILCMISCACCNLIEDDVLYVAVTILCALIACILIELVYYIIDRKIKGYKKSIQWNYH